MFDRRAGATPLNAKSLAPRPAPDDRHDEALEAVAAHYSALPDLYVRWSIGGELDSPLPPGRLEAVRARHEVAFGQLLAQSGPGRVILLADCAERPLAYEALACCIDYCAGRRMAMPIWARGWAINLAERPRTELADHVGAAAVREHPRCILLERPDLGLRDGGAIDGMALRAEIARWSAAFAENLLVAVIGRENFAFQDPLPGWLIAECTASASRNPPKEGQLPDFHPRIAPPEALLARAGDSADGKADGFAPLYELFSADYPGYPLDALLLDSATLPRFDPAEVQHWLGMLIDGNACDGAIYVPRSPRGDALAAARLYVLAHKLNDQPRRNTFVGRDLARWFCYLRSFGHEMLAVVAARLDRELLAGINLMHAPPLAHCRMTGVDLSDSDLYRIDLSQADLRESCFDRADLSRSHLKSVDMRGASLVGADLSYASLELADLRGAKLSGANRFRCDMDHARLDDFGGVDA